MNKILSIILIFILTFSSIYAYNPTIKDEQLLNNVYLKIWPIIDKAPTKVWILQKKISELKDQFKNNDRIVYIFTELENFIDRKVNPNSNKYIVSSVVDWDTVRLINNWEEIKVRMIWVDAPESNSSRFWYIECYWKESSDFLKNLIEWKEVEIEYDLSQWKTDIYGRVLAYIKYEWENINEKMIKEWYAWEYLYDKNYKYLENFKTSQESAKLNNNWLWLSSNCNWERREFIENQEETYDYSNFSCGTKTYCTQMNSCEEARFFLNTCGLNRLDKDNDWIPCESICN
jgi:endonuclease YncB( thermonuclease family)